jgi:Zn-finger nucleic acid-binding protein
MNCPNCHSDFEQITLKNRSGASIKGKHCNSCAGFWFDSNVLDQISPASAVAIDPPTPNYSLQEYNFVCPIDGTIMAEEDGMITAPGSRYWHCPECQGLFVPRGQLGLLTQAIETENRNLATSHRPSARTRWAEAITLVGLGVVFTGLAISADQSKLLASTTGPLPTVGPNILALSLLAVTYLAGTILAVLGRRAPIIFMGWSVIAICLFGFSVIIFGP